MATTDINMIVNAVLNILRGQRDDKQLQRLSGNWQLNPQIFASDKHYIAGPIEFTSPYQTTPKVTFGQIAQQDVQNIATQQLVATGYTPLIVQPYVYGFVQGAGVISAFYMGLYALTSPPPANNKYTICWMSEGKGSPYSQQRIDEAWTSSYNQNEANYLVNTTSGSDSQG